MLKRFRLVDFLSLILHFFIALGVAHHSPKVFPPSLGSFLLGLAVGVNGESGGWSSNLDTT